MDIKKIENIRELVGLMGESDISEISLQDGEVKLTLKRERAALAHEVYVSAPQAHHAPMGHAAPAQAAAPAASPAADENLHYITAPLVGTFYSSPAPDAPAYVSVGDQVKKGQTLCIIEAMKLMNEIESDVTGVVTAILVENASAVDYGAKIYAIKPN